MVGHEDPDGLIQEEGRRHPPGMAFSLAFVQVRSNENPSDSHPSPFSGPEVWRNHPGRMAYEGKTEAA